MRVTATLILAVWTAASVTAQPAPSLSAEDRAAIQQLSVRYAELLGACKAAEYAALFASPDGYFFSTFRGRVEGREPLIELVDSERHCINKTPRAMGAPPTVAIEPAPGGARGTAMLGATVGAYEDVYVKTPDGWRFRSRSVFTPQELAARNK